MATAKDAVRAAPDPKLDRIAAATYIHIVNNGSGQCLAVPGGSKAQGTGLIQWPCGTWNDHFWRFDDTGGGTYHVVNYNSGECLAVEGGSHNNGAKAIQWPCGTWADHYWR
ncbi:RICIN domain-containing protein [Streptomyces sp. NPDC048696]|uniref:RICIN domain-containing protein n=1 Tax=Streptomyces sp. NPDC048696 TaxID=3365585 RepID=UPI003711F032